MENLQHKLRFPEFKDDWNNNKLEEFCTFFSGGTPSSTNKLYYNGNIPFIKSGEISSNKTEQFLTEEGLSNSSAKLVNKGDILYALYGATSGQVSISKIDGAINQAVLCIRQKNNNTYFLKEILSFNKQNIVDRYIQGGQGNLSGSIIKKLDFNFPSLPEQTKIADFLGAVDKQLELLTTKKDKLHLYKKGVMQKLFSKEIRFTKEDGTNYPDWQEKTLGEIGEFKNGINKSKNDFGFGVPFINLNDVFRNKTGYANKNRSIS
ncbi:restriction endonuclease subunit S [Empedobacter falsenii]